MPSPHATPDVTIIGAGQAGLATAYWLRRMNVPALILDAAPTPGGAWPHTWDGLRLFSPARYSSLPGTLMPGGPDHYPGRDEVTTYLAQYELKYDLRVQRPTRVTAVHAEPHALRVLTDRGEHTARAVVSATGTYGAPYIPDVPGRDVFTGTQLHSSRYRTPEPHAGQRVLIVGGGNSGAQILAEVSRVAHTTWVTLAPPRFLPDHVDGRALFDAATERYNARERGEEPEPPASLGDIVMVPPVREARERGVLHAHPMISALTVHGARWADGKEAPFDTVIWCTGFRPDLTHLRTLNVIEADGTVRVRGTRSLREPRLWTVGYGSWTGFASATLIGVGRSARQTAAEIAAALDRPEGS